MIITITTLSGERVSAPLERWVQALILRLPPSELLELMRMVDAKPPLIVAPNIPAYPEGLNGKVTQ